MIEDIMFEVDGVFPITRHVSESYPHNSSQVTNSIT